MNSRHLCSKALASFLFITLFSAPMLAPATPPVAPPPVAVATTGTAPRLIPPIVWGCDDEWKLLVGGDTRLRLENRHNWDMDRDRDDSDNLALYRTRVNLDLTYRQVLRAYMTVLDARQFGVRKGFDPRQEDHFDLIQAWLGITPPGSPWSVKLGRQYLPILGDGRLISTPPWPNLLTVAEGALATYTTPDVTTNFLLFRPTTYLDRRRDGRIVSGSVDDIDRQLLYGLYSTFKVCPPHEFDLYALGMRDSGDPGRFPAPAVGEDDRHGTTDRYTVGTRGRGPLLEQEGGVLGYGYEAAYQFGRRANDDIRAYMIAGDLNYTWKHPWKPKLVLEGHLASGDRKPGDGVSNTFVPLYGAVHPRYGIMDFIRLQNLREIALVGSIEPTKKLKFQLELHNLWLDSKTDAWYGASGNAVARDKAGRSGRKVGQEIDAVLTYKQNDCLTWEAGAGYFVPGTFADKRGRGDAARFLYLQTVFSF